MDALKASLDGKRNGGLQTSNQLAALCKAAAEPLRLDILRVLSNDSFGVQELATTFNIPQPGMSHHLKVLAKGGLVAMRRQGNSIFYRRTLVRQGSDFHDFLVQLFTTIDELPLSEEVLARIQGVYEDRSSQSRLYFERNVDKFSENQGMLCELDQYLPNLREILDLMGLPRSSRVMEVGPGQGQLLRELAKRFDHMVALDNSEEMLAFTQKSIGLKDRIQFVQSSLEACDPGYGDMDAVVMNMVLHHMPSPLQAFQKVRQLLKHQGCLVIADLCSHNQEWTRASCGDIWLGFDPQDLKDWGARAGFVEDQSLYLGLKNGFQIQLKLFRAI
jgi:ubiquinone/menaquinone biosynthesis C-methylase UbiE/DNA-binding MarR family transcriptional regulator